MEPHAVTSFHPSTASTSSRILFTNRLGNWFRCLIAYLMTSIYEYFNPGLTVYREVPLSPLSAERLMAVGRKTLVLDLDETMVHSCPADLSPTKTGCPCQVPEHVVPDFVVNVDYIGGYMIPIRVFKRPHIDSFLRLVSKWYDLVIFTASMENYANQVLDRLDGGRGMLNRRFYRQHCRADRMLTKDLSLICTDMRGVFIIDNLPRAYMDFPNNALPIKSYLYDPKDTELLKLLPFLDALRFTKDVRSVLGRRVYR